jgi:SAM-dependent methyltransferase
MSLFKDESRISSAFRKGNGIRWEDRSQDLFDGTERYFKPIYEANLTRSWIPSLQGAEEKLRKGCKVADVGCGHGTSTIVMAKAYPNSTFFGFDNHKPSIEMANKLLEEEQLGKERVFFDVASSTDYPGHDYDLVTFFACLHDFGDPVGSAVHALQSLKPDGTVMIMEPFANDQLEDNLKNPSSRIFYAISTLVCIPASLSQNGPALGAQAGERRINEIVTSAGFRHFRRAAYSPFSMVFEAKP